MIDPLPKRALMSFITLSTALAWRVEGRECCVVVVGVDERERSVERETRNEKKEKAAAKKQKKTTR
jgi:hypothetical protein